MSTKITGGYVQFAIFNEERTHIFNATDELGWLEHYVAIGRAEKGLQDFIRLRYIHPAIRKQWRIQEPIRVINYEFTGYGLRAGDSIPSATESDSRCA